MHKEKEMGEIFVESDLITVEQLNYALSIQRVTKQKVGKILLELGYVTKDQITDALSKRLSIPIISCEEHIISDELKKLVPKEIAKREIVLPIKKEHDTLIIAMADPLNIKTIGDISFRTKLKVSPAISYEWSILAAVEKNYTNSDFKYDTADAKTPPQKVIQFMDDKQVRDDISIDILHEKGATPSIVNLVERLIAEAIKLNASDIHIEPRERFIQARYRIDGDLHNISKHDRTIHEPLVSRIKILSSLDITNRRLPQDGNFHVSLLGREIDIRVSIVPSIHGEKVVIRLLDQRSGLIPLDELAIPGYIKDPITEIFKKPQGMLIVTGPTGSGKTTTLNACINQLRSESKNIITIENPVEYKIEGVTQIPINEAIGRTFAMILRSILRQDPDIIMVGEIRDIETAEAAIEAALTGHLVLATLHTNNTVATITRLLQIGIPPYLLSSALGGILAQRLVKKICNYCKVKSKISDDLLSIIKHYSLPELKEHYYGTGCPDCMNTGYSGRVAVYEYLPINYSFRKLILEDADEQRMFIEAKKNGVAFLFEEAWNKIKAGMLTIEDVITKVPLDYGINMKNPTGA